MKTNAEATVVQTLNPRTKNVTTLPGTGLKKGMSSSMNFFGNQKLITLNDEKTGKLFFGYQQR